MFSRQRRVLAALLLAAAAVSSLLAYDLSTDQVQYVVGTSHLDTQWQWTIQTTISQYVPMTLRGNFVLFKKYPGYVFSFEGAYRYMLAKQYYRSAYDSLKTFVAGGNWAVAGSMVDACDVNVPSAEALVRQVLYGNGFFQDEFGKRSVDIFLPDCFGFGYALPTIAAHCGLKGFSTQKLSWNEQRQVPFSIGVWKGVDGSQIVAALNPGEYVSSWNINAARAGGITAGYDYMGVGDMGGSCYQDPGWGGGCTEASVSSLMTRIGQNGSQTIKVVSAPSDQLFRDLTNAQVASLPVYDGELVMETHGVGTYTHHADLKWRNHVNEQTAYAAEAAAVMAEWSTGKIYGYPRDALKKAWIRFLAHQMHDDLTGTSIPGAYVYTKRDQDSSIAEFTAIRDQAMAAVAGRMDTRTGDAAGIPVVVVNSLGFDRTDVVEALVTFTGTAPTAVRVYDAQGNETPSQIISSSGQTRTVAFVATVPSMGSAVYEARAAQSASAISTGVTVTTTSLENENYRVTINANGDISSVVDKRNSNKELLSAPARLELFPDRDGSEYPQWEIWYENYTATPTYVDGSPAIAVKEQGPARVALEVKRSKNGSSFTQVYRLASGGGFLDIETEINWNSKGYLLKAGFPFAASNANATYDLGIGTIKRGTMTSSLYEVPAQNWADITNSDGTFGAAVLTDYKRGWHKSSASTIHLTLIHSPESDAYECQGDVFLHPKFHYAICGHAGTWQAGGVVAQAGRLNQPLVALQTSAHAGQLGKSFSMLRLNGTVAVMALKKAERSDNYIVRVRETSGSAAAGASCSFGTSVTSAAEVNGQEDAMRSVATNGSSFSFDLRGYQPRAFAVSLTGGSTVAPGARSSSPNPSQWRISLRRSGANPALCLEVPRGTSKGRALLTLKDMMGRTVLSRAVDVTDGGLLLVRDLGTLPRGICIATITIDSRRLLAQTALQTF